MPITNSKEKNNDFRKLNFGTIHPFITFIMIMQKKKKKERTCNYDCVYCYSYNAYLRVKNLFISYTLIYNFKSYLS